jgi:DNA-binding LytR/AlgR family response regulator
MLNCIIVDEDIQTVQALKNHIRKIPMLECIGSFPNPKEALVFLKNKPADLVFYTLRKTYQTDSTQISIFQLHAMVVLLSSNKNHAYEAFENNVTDFLLKPVTFEQLLRTVEKSYKIKYSTGSLKSVAESESAKGGYIFIKESTRLVRLELDDIYYVMGLKNYVSIMTKTHRIVSLQTMKQMEELLPSKRFIRVHRSYFVALDKIISVEKQQIHIKDKVIPIGSMYLPLFMKKIAKISN